MPEELLDFCVIANEKKSDDILMPLK